MQINAAIIGRFYSAFQKLDYKSMQDCYADDIIFNDPVFGILEGSRAKAMWEMLCKNAKNFKLTYSDIQLLDDQYATCNWTAIYTFSKTGKTVVNKIKAHMKLENGKIAEHTDQFNFSKWCRQALGIPGILLGWSNWFKNKVRKQAQQNLDKFIMRENLF